MIACLRSLEVCFDYRNQSISERASGVLLLPGLRISDGFATVLVWGEIRGV
jgi:hypothetical protein